MKNIQRALLISMLSFGLFFVSVSFAHAEVIKDFTSRIAVASDSSITVTEKITYDYEATARHGIYRSIQLTNSRNEPISIDVISVTDDTGFPYNFRTSTSNQILTIQIGDAKKLITGIHKYDITYQVIGSIGYFDTYDEIYWNVTGNQWQVPIEKAQALVSLPGDTQSLQEACYAGVQGHTEKCTTTRPHVFSSGRILSAGEGLTVAVGFPKGVVSIYAPKQDSKLVAYIKNFWPLCVPSVVFLFMYLRWSKKGRDPKGTGVIVAQYDVPDGLTPLEVSGIIYEKVKSSSISAEIIYLATHGYIKIGYIEGKILGVFSSTDYTFTFLKDFADLPNNADRKILEGIFGGIGAGSTVTLSSLRNSFYNTTPLVTEAARTSLLQKEYYKNLPTTIARYAGFALLPVVGFIMLMIGFGFSGNDEIRPLFILSFIVSIIATGIIIAIFSRLMPAKTQKGVTTYEYLLGLKEYLSIAEKDRLQFHNAPEKKPEIFEMLLPYAMVFGVEELWAKEFEGIYLNPPSWYSSPAGTFNALAFGHQMATFNSMTILSLNSAPGGSSGSGGGGFSGGGGGGGGGGSW